jgi:predicted XRE-type DNA-binding protein
MKLDYENIFDVTSTSSKQAAVDKELSDAMIEIHDLLDFNKPIKNTVNVLGVTPSQARNLTKGDIGSFSIFELRTFIERLTKNN